MPIANPINPRKKFLWTLEFEGLEPLLAQKVSLPKISIETAEHGSGNLLVKTGGMVKLTELEVSKLMFANKNEGWAYEWLKKVANPETGSNGVPTDYKKNGYLVYLQPDQETILQKWQLIGCFPKEYEIEELDKTSSDNLIEKITISVDYMVKTDS